MSLCEPLGRASTDSEWVTCLDSAWEIAQRCLQA